MKWWLIVLAALLAVGCSTVDPVTGQQVNNLYTIEDDIQLGRQVLGDIIKKMREENVPINADREKVAKLQEMVRRITAVSHMPDLPYEIYLFETNIVNAFAAPGGQMGVFSGLYHPEQGLVRDDDELAAVIAHEVAHVTCRHVTEALTRELPVRLALLGGMIYAEVKGKEELAAGLAVGFLVYEGLILPKYSRENEFEADRVGTMYMAKAGYDPRAAVRIWERAAARSKDPKLFAFLSSHPTDSQRAEALKKILPEAIAEYERARAAGRPQ
ncbi:MAG: M48 family metallopeptidase [Kiritimatiellae bacterium]|nr:M48 family metallopeptidase [Kiritimatiellia bacterium]MDW8458254.1 M48 family metallopeptidase [Verrucomicrobiota bacterium]